MRTPRARQRNRERSSNLRRRGAASTADGWNGRGQIRGSRRGGGGDVGGRVASPRRRRRGAALPTVSGCRNGRLDDPLLMDVVGGISMEWSVRHTNLSHGSTVGDRRHVEDVRRVLIRDGDHLAGQPHQHAVGGLGQYAPARGTAPWNCRTPRGSDREARVPRIRCPNSHDLKGGFRGSTYASRERVGLAVGGPR